MSDYYSERLSAERLKRCYEIAPPRVRQYLEAELNHVLQRIRPGDSVLELGCGYGRILPCLAEKTGLLVGIDTSFASLLLGRKMLCTVSDCYMLKMDAVHLAFRSRIFDVVICIQNGISAFHVNQKDLIVESIRVARPGGTVLFSSYSHRFWKDRLEWFRLQSRAGLLGEIDWDKTRDGMIVCNDGFTGTAIGSDQFLSLTAGLNAEVQIIEVDESSLFCEIKKLEKLGTEPLFMNGYEK